MLVTPAELATYTDQTFSNRQEDAASMVLLGLQAELETWLRRPVEAITITGETHYVPLTFGLASFNTWYDQTNPPSNADQVNPVRPVGPYSFPLLHTPVISVTSVTIDGTAASAGVDFIFNGWGLDMYTVYPNAVISVTYQAGHSASALPLPFFKLLILRAASREMQNMFDDVVGIKDLTPKESALATTGFTEAELFSCRKWRRKQLT